MDTLPAPLVQDRIFPHGEFDAFICTLERLSGTNALKHHMREKRAELLRVRLRWGAARAGNTTALGAVSGGMHMW